jgi:D-alanyl-lipoteichoic acid acyltransferase DltB (MBOAT superfamily)
VLFTSLEFFLFVPLTLVVFGAVPAAQRWLVLLLASYVFYGAQHPLNLVYLGAVTVVVHGCALALARANAPLARRLWLALGLVVVLGALVAFKFYDFLAGEAERGLLPPGWTLPRLGLSAPAGFSFYAFSAASYLIDSYTRRLAAAHSAGAAALYLAFFPKILAGPIERATTLLPQLHALRPDPTQVVHGLQLIVWGLFKKVVIADALAPVVDRNFAIVAFASPVELLISVYFFAFQIYCDFSGYTDVAIGVALLFGVRLMENFRRPYLSRSTAEFWGERWHISLGHWFRDYLYIPLGGSRVGTLRRYLNVMMVFVVSGLWHAGLGYGIGWTFLVWGALNGAYQWIGLATGSLWRRLGEHWPRVSRVRLLLILRVLVTFHLILITWVFFRARSIGDAILVLRKIGANADELPFLLAQYPFSAEQISGFALIVALIVIELLDERRSLWQRLAAAPVALRWSVYYGAIFALLLFGRWQAKEFIYMQF